MFGFVTFTFLGVGHSSNTGSAISRSVIFVSYPQRNIPSRNALIIFFMEFKQIVVTSSTPNPWKILKIKTDI